MRLGPHISPTSIMLKWQRVAKVRGLDESKVRTLAEGHIEPLQFGLFGQERVNVLKLNIALDELARRA